MRIVLFPKEWIRFQFNDDLVQNNIKIKWKIHNEENCSASEIVIAVYGWRKLYTLS